MGRKYTRRDHMLDYIEQNQHVSVAEICDAFSVSPATARRDLDSLAKDAKVRRIRGGAIVVNGGSPDLPLRSRALDRTEEKARIGKAASELIEDGDTVCLGGGTTVTEVAHHLRDRHNLTVITNSVPVMEILKDTPGIMLIGLGGVLRPSLQAFIGHITEQALSELRADIVIMGIHGIDVDRGLTNDDPICTQTERAMLAIGSRAIIVADHTKCQRAGIAFVEPLAAIRTLITDTDVPPDFVSTLSARGIQVVRA